MATSTAKAPPDELGAHNISEKDPRTSYHTRLEILQELGNLGLNVSNLDALPVDELRNMLTNIYDLLQVNQRGISSLGRNGIPLPFLSNTDKKVIETLLATEGFASSKDLSKQLNIPLSTLQRRRKKLEATFIQRQYTLRMEKLGYRTATLFVSTGKRRYDPIGREILRMSDMVTFVSATIGQSSMDLRVEAVFKTSQDLMSLIDKIKSLDGVRDVIWNESVEMIGKKNTYPKTIF